MMYYLDSSAWVKYYLVEQGSEWVSRFLAKSPRCAVHELAVIEVAATILRRHQSQQAGRELSQQTVAEVNRHFQGFLAIPFTALSLESIQTVLFRHRLRGADAIHLAAVLWLTSQLKSEPVTLVASDAELLRAALAEGIATINPMTV